jgi:hypothetical protein
MRKAMPRRRRMNQMVRMSMGEGLVVVGIIIVDEAEDDNAEDEEKCERVKSEGHEKRPFRAGSSIARRVARAVGSRRPSAVASMAARA